ncbi:hypothetical protein FSP39_021306 [Pinctada imbricata]|uniref:Major facilitator superfamily (MFS) profile domain-containing protein n=1 Tax=Pinctada imbricata TaxID=66713 RepID=A0AA89C1W1_PINIB|nr:hypothetical protein FSP39_021306 [Pinctada imbricata]
MAGVVDVDKIWKALGVWKPYQLSQLFYIYACTVPVAYPVLSWVFIGYTPPSQCKALSSNLSEYDIGLTGNVSDFRIEYGKCDLTIHSTNNTPDPYQDMKPRKFDCLNGYHFDHSEGETVTMEFGLICGKSGLGEFSTTMVLVGMCLGAAIFPSLSDRFGRKTVAVVTHVFMLAANLALAFMPNLASFATFRTIIGTLQQGLGLSTAIIHVEIFPMEWRGFLGFTGSVNWSLCVCSLALFGYLMRNLSWRYLQLALSLVSFHALFGPWILDESLRWLIANNKNTKAVRLIEKAARWNKKDPRKILSLLDPEKEEMLQLKDTEYKYETVESKAYVPTSGKDKQESVSEATITEKYSFLDILKNRVLLRNSLILWYTWAVNSGTYYGLFLTSSSLSFGNRYLNYFINGLVEIPAALAYFAVINRIGRKYTCVLFHGLAGVSLILSVALLAATKEDGDAAAIASTIFSYSGKLGISASFLTIFMYTPELYPTNLRNVGIGIASATGRIGGMMSPYSSVLVRIGKLYQMQYAIWAPGVLFGSCCLVAMVLMFFLPETGGYILPQTIEEMEKWTKEQSYFRPYKNKQQLVVDDEKRKTDE